MKKPILFLDFDNTVTLGDVLDTVIERFSATESWRGWETDWREGRITTAECLRRQVGDLRATSGELHAFVEEARIDPAFAEIVAWSERAGVETRIVSDSFSSLIGAILRRNGLERVSVSANELVFRGDRIEPRFPFGDPACARCAHCKAIHLRPITDRTRVYVGDGLSDICPALVADVVFAKDSLAAEMSRRKVPFRPFETLADVSRYLGEHFAGLSAR